MSRNTGFYKGRLGIGLLHSTNYGDGSGNPLYPLEIDGDIRLTGAILHSDGTPYSSGGGLGIKGVYSKLENDNWYFGFGKSNPAYALDVSGSINNKGIRIEDDDSGQLDLKYNVIDSTSDPLYINLGNDTGDVVLCQGGGNVGIGTTSPSTKLHISGDMHISDTLGVTNYDKNEGITFKVITSGDSDANTSSYIQFKEDDDGGHGFTIGYCGDSGSNGMNGMFGWNDDTFNIQRHDNDTTGATCLTINSGDGNVGIGTSSPNTKLHIRNDTATTGTGDAFIPSLSSNSDNSKPTECLRLQCGSTGKCGVGALIRFTNYYASGSNPSTDEYNLAGIAGYDVKGDWGGGLCFYTAPDTDNGGDLTTRMVINDVGNVGIGTTNPLYPLHIKSGVASFSGKGFDTKATTSQSQAVLNTDGRRYAIAITTSGTLQRDAANWHSNVGTHYFSALFQENIAVLGPFIVLASDERIKENIIDVNDNYALTTLRNIPVRYYEYKDKTRGANRTIGFIAQEVREILPEAVDLAQHFIPNKMSLLSNISWEKIDSENTDSTNKSKYKLTSNLQDVSGVKYRFYVLDNIENESEREKEVELVGNSDNTFTFNHPWKTIFCYGKQVDDFHRLDKNKLFTINFSATQEIDRQQQADKAKIAELESKNQTLENKVATLESELAAIKSHLGL